MTQRPITMARSLLYLAQRWLVLGCLLGGPLAVYVGCGSGTAVPAVFPAASSSTADDSASAEGGTEKPSDTECSDALAKSKAEANLHELHVLTALIDEAYQKHFLNRVESIPPLPSTEDGCASAAFHVNPDGSMTQVRGKDPSFCLDQTSNGQRGRWSTADPPWVRLDSLEYELGTPHDALRILRAVPGTTYTLSDPRRSAWSVEIDANVPTQEAIQTKFQAGVLTIEDARRAISQLAPTVFRMVLPSRSESDDLLVWNAVGPPVFLSTDLRRGDRLDIVAYNVRTSADGSPAKRIAVTKGDPVLPENTLNLAAIFAGAKVLFPLPAGEKEAVESPGKKLYRCLYDQAARVRVPPYTSAFATWVVDGGFNYSVQLSKVEPETPPAASASASSSPCSSGAVCALCCAAPAASSASAKTSGDAPVSFTTRARHRVVSVVAEGAWGHDVSGFSNSGYGYLPDSQSQGGPDQLYTLAPNPPNHANDLTVAALLAAYPLAAFDWSKWADGLAIGFGPTLYRGSGAEFAKQWNLRAMYEFPFAPGFLVSTGPSFREVDVPNGIGASVSIPRPATPPTLTTEPRTAFEWSVGVSVDLALVTTAASSVAGAVTGKSGGGQ